MVLHVSTDMELRGWAVPGASVWPLARSNELDGVSGHKGLCSDPRASRALSLPVLCHEADVRNPDTESPWCGEPGLALLWFQEVTQQEELESDGSIDAGCLPLEHKQLLKNAQMELKRSKRKDYYKILGVDKNASEDEIKKAYRKRALMHHPGRAGKTQWEECIAGPRAEAWESSCCWE